MHMYHLVHKLGYVLHTTSDSQCHFDLCKQELTLLAFHIDIIYSDGMSTQNWIFGYTESAKKMGLRQVEQGFFHFLLNF